MKQMLIFALSFIRVTSDLLLCIDYARHSALVTQDVLCADRRCVLGGGKTLVTAF